MNKSLELTTKLFQAHFSDADYHLEMANQNHLLLKESAKGGPGTADQKFLKIARAHGRACIITAIAGLESLCNCIYTDFKKYKFDTVSHWIPKKKRRNKFEDLRLEIKTRFIPVFCNKDINAPSYYYQNAELEFQRLREVIDIRNTLVHASNIKSRYSIVFGPNQLHTIHDSLSDLLPATKFHQDLERLSAPEAEYTYRLILNLIKQMLKQTDAQIDRRYLLFQDVLHGNERHSVLRAFDDGGDPNWLKILLGS